MIVVNSVCGCAAGKARPGVAMALQHDRRPDRVAHGVRGRRHRGDRSRARLRTYPPSSPSVGLLRDGKLVFMLQRGDIENRDARRIADRLTAAFDQFCGTPAKNRDSRLVILRCEIADLNR